MKDPAYAMALAIIAATPGDDESIVATFAFATEIVAKLIDSSTDGDKAATVKAASIFCKALMVAVQHDDGSEPAP